MYIKHATLHNIGPHVLARLGSPEQPLPRGTVGIFGANGAGKTTVTEAIISAFRNDFTGIADTKKKVIFDGAGEKDKSKVEICFQHAEQEYVLTNSIRPDKIILADAAGKEITGWENVAAKFEDIGIQLDVLNAVFLRQNAIDGLFSTTPTVRAALYMKMLMLGGLSNLNKVLPQFAASKRLAITVIDQSDNIRVEMDRLAEEIKTTKAKRDEVLAQCMTTAEYEALRDAVALISQRAGIEKEIADLRKRYRESRKSIEAARKVLRGIAEWRRKLALTKSAVAEAKRHQAEIADYRTKKAEYAVYLANKEKMEKAKKALDAHVVPAFDQDKANEVKAEYLKAKDTRDQLKDWVESMKELKGKAKCPTCKQNIENIAKMITQQEKALEEARAALMPLKAEIDRLTEQFNTQKAALDARDRLQLAYLTAKKIAEKVVAKPVIENVKSKMHAIKQARLKIDNRNKEVKKLRAAVADLKSYALSFKEQKTTLAARKKTLAQLGSGGDDRTEELEAQDTLRQEAAELKGTVAQLEKNVVEQEDKLKENKRRLEENATLQHRLTVIDNVGELFHPRRLPLRVSRACLKELEPAVNRNLKKFGANFVCTPTDDLDLMVRQPERGERSIRRLSYGQRVVLSICFFLAQLELFAGDVGMLVLDEPTANLDEKNRRYLGEVLKNVSRSLRNRLQMIVITHDPHLKSSFDRVIEIG